MPRDISHIRQDELMLQDIENFNYSLQHARMRVYPRLPSETIRLTPNAVADTWGAWTEMVPAGVISFPYHVVGVMVENQQGADSWMCQMADNNPPAIDTDYIGEWRMHLGALAGFFPTNYVCIRAKYIDAGSGVYGRVMSAAGTNWIDISLFLTRHIPLQKSVTLWPNWPW